jgi:hypothetical protein
MNTMLTEAKNALTEGASPTKAATESLLKSLQADMKKLGWTFKKYKQQELFDWSWTKGSRAVSVSGWVDALFNVDGEESDRKLLKLYESPIGVQNGFDLVGRAMVMKPDKVEQYLTKVLPAVKKAVLDFAKLNP